MPSVKSSKVEKTSGKKRKSVEAESIKKSATKKSKTPSATKPAAPAAANSLSPEDLLALEESIVESPKNYNKIIDLHAHFKRLSKNPELGVTAAVSLCRTFCRLMAKGRLARRKEDTAEELEVIAWLKERYNEYFTGLCGVVGHEEQTVQNTAVTLLMRLVKEEATHLKPEGELAFFPYERFEKVVKALVTAGEVEEVYKMEFVEKYVNEYDDIRYGFLQGIEAVADDAREDGTATEEQTGLLINLMLAIKNLPSDETALLGNYYAISPPKKMKNKPPVLQISQHRRAVQDAWLSILRNPITEEQQKQVLAAMTAQIVPSFTKPELLMDFLIACYDAGGSTSLLALNGVFHLIQTKNLDYPNFYTKLYALLNADLFHVRYRSRFFRLLERFLESTHLPSALIASFIKRMSRLCLNAPPGAIVTVVPFIYNLFKKHRACTYMMHREASMEDREYWRKNGYDGDPFDPEEADPMNTGAIDSCIWEIHTLMNHWHPNVATLCRIIGEQFTKERYSLEDFLDHSYGSIFDAEANKTIRKPPVVEYEIPKKIFFKPEPVEGKEVLQTESNPLQELWAFE